MKKKILKDIDEYTSNGVKITVLMIYLVHKAVKEKYIYRMVY